MPAPSRRRFEPPRVRTKPGSITSKRAPTRAVMQIAASSSGILKGRAQPERGHRRRYSVPPYPGLSSATAFGRWQWHSANSPTLVAQGHRGSQGELNIGRDGWRVCRAVGRRWWPGQRVCVVGDDEIGFVSGHFAMPGETMVKSLLLRRRGAYRRPGAPVPRNTGRRTGSRPGRDVSGSHVEQAVTAA